VSLRLKLERSALKLRVDPRIPAQLVGGTGIEITRANSVYTADLNYDEIGTITSYQDLLEPTTYLVSWESIGDTFSKTSITDIKSDFATTFGGLYQPLDADLTAIAGLASAADRLPYFTGSGTASLATFTAFARTLVDDANQAAMRTTLGLTPGTDVQAFDADLSALAANSTDGFWAHTGAGTGAARTLTAPAAGLTISNPAGIAGNPTFALANDLSALEGLGSTGIARRTGTDTWSVGTAVANSEFATMAAYTFKGNNTSGSATPTDVDIAALTTKAVPAAGDYVMVSDQAASGAWKKATVSTLASAGSVASLNGQTGAIVSYFPPQGRLTLTSGTPVLTSATTGNLTVYYTPYLGDLTPIYDGTNIVPTVFAELSQALTDTTKSPAAAVLSTNYDLFVWNDAGTIRCTRGPAWSSSTARGTGAGTTELVRVKGLLLNAVAITNGPAAQRGTYVGTVRTRAADALIDWNPGGAASGGTAAQLMVWNAYNRVLVSALVTDNGSPYTYSSATVRQARASSGNQVNMVIGLAEESQTASYQARGSVAAASGAAMGWTIGLDGTGAAAWANTVISNPASVAFAYGAPNAGSTTFGIGLHFVAALEFSDGVNSSTYDSSSNNVLSVTTRM
jgi:hypothetical protein